MFTQRHQLLHRRHPASPIGFRLQDRFDCTMHQQIRIATNGAGEVHVALQTQTKMACIIRPVDRLLHAAQHQLLIEPTSVLRRNIPQQ